MLKPALGVLAAITDRIPPAAADLEELRQFAPDCAHNGVDDLAGAVVQRVLKKPREGYRETLVRSAAVFAAMLLAWGA